MNTINRTRRGFLGILGAPLAGCGAGSAGVAATTTEAAQPAPAPSSGRVAPIPFWIQLHGPVARQAAMQYVSPSIWQYPGSALTAATKLWRFDLGMPRVRWAHFRAVWTAETTLYSLRVVHADDGPVNITPLPGAVIESRGRGLQLPDNQHVDITDALNALRGGPYKDIGFQVHGDGLTQFSMWEARIEGVWEIDL